MARPPRSALEAPVLERARRSRRRDFFAPCLRSRNATTGPPGSSAARCYMLVGVPTADFALRGGKIRLVCSPRLSPQDICGHGGWLRVARSSRTRYSRELDEYLSDPTGLAVTRLLATLIAYGAIEIKIAFRAGTAIFHDKVGIFEDSRATSSPSPGPQTRRGRRGPATAITSISTRSRRGPMTPRESRTTRVTSAIFGTGWSPISLWRTSPSWFGRSSRSSRTPTDREQPNSECAQATDTRPLRPPFAGTKRNRLDAWATSGHRGIFEHATGSGKTITALNAIEAAFEAGKRALVLVPSRDLLRQWAAEAQGVLRSRYAVAARGRRSQ